MEFASVFIDENDLSDPDKPPRYLRTVDRRLGNERALSRQAVIWPTSSLDHPTTSTIPAGPTACRRPRPSRAAWSTSPTPRFSAAATTDSDVWVKSSNDCGATWSNGAKLTASVPLNQSPIIVVNPLNGNLHVVWREFGQNGSADRILMALSTNAAKTFGQVSEVINLGVPQLLPTEYAWPRRSRRRSITRSCLTHITDVRMASRNGYPFACWAQTASCGWFSRSASRSNAPPEAVSSRVMFGNWIERRWSFAAIDNFSAWTRSSRQSRAPARAPTASGTTSATTSRSLTPRCLGGLPVHHRPIPVPPAHTIDVMAVQTDAVGCFLPEPGIQVSKYPIAYDSLQRR